MCDHTLLREKNTFVVIVLNLLAEQENWNALLKIDLKLMVNRLLRCLKVVNMLNPKSLKEK